MRLRWAELDDGCEGEAAVGTLEAGGSGFVERKQAGYAAVVPRGCVSYGERNKGGDEEISAPCELETLSSDNAPALAKFC